MLCVLKLHYLWLLDLFIHVPFNSLLKYTTLPPFRRKEFIAHIAISAISGAHLHLSEMKQVRVKCLTTRTLHRNNDVPALRGQAVDITKSYARTASIVPRIPLDTARLTCRDERKMSSYFLVALHGETQVKVRAHILFIILLFLSLFAVNL